MALIYLRWYTNWKLPVARWWHGSYE